MAEESSGSRRRPGSSAPRQGLGNGGTEGLNQKLCRLPGSGWTRGRDLGGGLRTRGRGFVPEAEGLAYRAAHPEASGGRAGQAAEPRPGPGPGRRSRRKARRRKKRLRPAPASFSRAALTRGLSPAGAGRGARDPIRAAHVPVRLWRALSETGWSPGGAPGLLMPRSGARREDLGEIARREREREIMRARGSVPRGVRGRQAPSKTAPPHPQLRRAGRCAPRREPSPTNFSTCPVPRPRWQELPRSPSAPCSRPAIAVAPECSLPAATATAAAGRPPSLAQRSAHRWGRRRGLAASRSLQRRGTPAATVGAERQRRSAVREGGGSVRPPRPPLARAAADAARGLPQPRVCGASPVT